MSSVEPAPSTIWSISTPRRGARFSPREKPAPSGGRVGAGAGRPRSKPAWWGRRPAPAPPPRWACRGRKEAGRPRAGAPAGETFSLSLPPLQNPCGSTRAALPQARRRRGFVEQPFHFGGLQLPETPEPERRVAQRAELHPLDFLDRMAEPEKRRPQPVFAGLDLGDFIPRIGSRLHPPPPPPLLPAARGGLLPRGPLPPA